MKFKEHGPIFTLFTKKGEATGNQGYMRPQRFQMLQKGMVFFQVPSEAPQVTGTRRSIKENYIRTKNSISQAINKNPFLGLLMVGGVVESIAGIADGNPFQAVFGTVAATSPYLAEKMGSVFSQHVEIYPFTSVLQQELLRMQAESEASTKRVESALGPFTQADTNFLEEKMQNR